MPEKGPECVSQIHGWTRLWRFEPDSRRECTRLSVTRTKRGAVGVEMPRGWTPHGHPHRPRVPTAAPSSTAAPVLPRHGTRVCTPRGARAVERVQEEVYACFFLRRVGCVGEAAGVPPCHGGPGANCGAATMLSFFHGTRPLSSNRISGGSQMGPSPVQNLLSKVSRIGTSS